MPQEMHSHIKKMDGTPMQYCSGFEACWLQHWVVREGS